MKFSKEVLEAIPDGDKHAKIQAIEYSTSFREVVTVGYMMEHYKNE